MGQDVTKVAAAGGRARAEKLSAEERSQIARLAAQKRWDGHPVPKATHEGVLRLGDIEVPCAVLADGTRLLTRAGFVRAIGRKGKVKGGRKWDQESKLPVFLTAANLKPFVSNELVDNSQPIQFRPRKGGVAMGYNANLLPQVCFVFLDALENGALRENQLHIAQTCKLVSRAFSAVGLAALIDEATGYQEIRARDELQKLLAAYIAPELLPWAKTFPDEFYEELFRLRGWDWKAVGGRRPRLVGKLTNFIIYDRLPAPVVEELRQRNPVATDGRRRYKLFQWLTEDIGSPTLKGYVIGSVALMRAAPTWTRFVRMLERAYPKPGSGVQQDFIEEIEE